MKTVVVSAGAVNLPWNSPWRGDARTGAGTPGLARGRPDWRGDARTDAGTPGLTSPC